MKPIQPRFGGERPMTAGFVEWCVDLGRRRFVIGGGRPASSGYFVEPAHFAGARSTMTLAREETFGPVGTIIAFDDEQDAIRLANDSDYAIAYEWTICRLA